VDKTTVQRELKEAWTALRSLVESLPPEALEQPGVVGDWSVKDLMGHVAFWNQRAAQNLEALAAGRSQEIETPTAEEEVSALNKRESGWRKGLTLAAVKEEWLSSFGAAREALGAVPGEKLNEEVKGWAMHTRFAVDTYHHYQEHLEQISAWRRELETTGA
jgi:hypothetical protein